MKKTYNQASVKYETLILARPFRKLPVPEWISAAVFAILCYAMFLILAAVSGNFMSVITSFMHLLQGFSSLCIFLGLLSASMVDAKFSRTFHQSRIYFGNISDEEYAKIVHSIAKKTNSLRGFIFSIPLMLCSITYFFVVVAPRIPDAMFPVKASSSVFLYATIFELSIGMIFLLGNVGYWFTYCMVKALNKLEESPMSLPALPTKRLLSEMSGFVLTYTVLLTLIISSVFPILLAMVINYSHSQYSLWIGGGGLGLVLFTAAVLYILPQFSLHKILVKAKENAIANLSQEYSENEAEILEQIKAIKYEEYSKERMLELEVLIKANAYLVERMLFLQSNIREWIIDISAVIAILTSSTIPIVTFILQIINLFIASPNP